MGTQTTDVFKEESVASTKRIRISDYTHLKRNRTILKKNHDIYCSRGGSHFFVRYDIGMSEYWIVNIQTRSGFEKANNWVLFEETWVGSGKYQVLKNLVRDVHWME